MLRNDSAVMVTLRHYEEFIKPYDQVLLDKFGGCIHYCGRGNAFVQSMAKSNHLYGIHSSQPELNNVNRWLRSTSENNIVALGLPQSELPEGLNTGVILLR